MFRLTVLCFLFPFLLLAQKPAEKCGSTALLQQKLAQDPELNYKLETLERETQSWIQANRQNLNRREILTIPVVVHVVWHNEDENLSDEQVLSQINVLNEDFRKTNSDADKVPAEFSDIVADIEIEFCLVSTDPDGNATNGITRTETNIPFIVDEYATGNRRRLKHDELGGKSAWDTKKYFNIWVAKYTPGTLGEGCFPGVCSQAEDGIIVDSHVFGTTGTAAENAPNHLGRTTTHEVGHYLNLQHIWGPDLGSCTNDDGVDDTPKQFFSSDGCPNHPKNTCSSNDMFMNYMDYTDDPCMFMFTNGQKMRMLAALEGPRIGLLTSNACQQTSSSKFQELDASLKIFPNPANDYINIELDHQEDKPLSLKLLNVVGKTVIFQTSIPSGTTPIDISHLPGGLYLIQISSPNAQLSRRLIINR